MQERRRPAGAQDGYREALLDLDQMAAAKTIQQGAVGLAAAQEDVLAVVHLKALTLE